MIINSDEIFNAFSKQFNARLNSLDFINNIEKLVNILNNKEPKDLKYIITLSCKHIEDFEELIKFRYDILLEKILKNVKIEDECIDNYISELGKTTFSIYKSYLLNAAKSIVIEMDHENLEFKIFCSELFMELIWSPISQFHTAISLELEHLNKILKLQRSFLEKTDEDVLKNNIYINSKVSTPYSYFILSYIAENLHIPLKLE